MPSGCRTRIEAKVQLVKPTMGPAFSCSVGEADRVRLEVPNPKPSSMRDKRSGKRVPLQVLYLIVLR